MRRLVVGAALLVLVVLVAGCGGDPKADPSPSTSAPPPSVTPTPTPPALPDAAKANTKAGAIAFATYYVDLVNSAQATGGVAGLISVEAESCASCSDVRTSITRIYQAGGSITGSAWHPHFNTALRNGDGSWLVNGLVEFDPGQIKRSAGGPTEPNKGGSAVTHLTVRMTGSGWEVTAWSRDS